ncbi:MAG TPA: hypothetical protein VM888_00320 [Chitinophagaceae bacterium]|jgi:hypothetical protein|nr:hypothetical protein [Chitinophagaceae bacterium]
MVKTKKLELTASVGEEIGQELGTQMISTYRSANPTDVLCYYVGRNILEQVMAQPGCVGIKFYNAYNEVGQKTLVYVGVNANGDDMLSITTINTNGELSELKGIVADRVKLPPPPPHDENGWWSFD